MSKKNDLLNLLRTTSGTQYELAKKLSMFRGNWTHHDVRSLICVLRAEGYNILNEVVPNTKQTRYKLFEEKVVQVNNKMKKTLYNMPRGAHLVFSAVTK